MAKDSSTALRNKSIYQVFPRQFSETHDLQGVINNLDRIKRLNVDYIYLLPIHPIGKVNRKGTYGSPYSIVDYYRINPDLGNLENFKILVRETHARGMGLILDIVFNHTAHDAAYTKTHPEWYFRKDGKFTNRVGDWWDIIDLNFENKELWEELLGVLRYWAELGIDGIRADVAPLIPLEFWMRARAELKKINPEFLMVAETVHLHFIKYLRDRGFSAHSDGEMFQAFDICYDYDIFDDFLAYFREGKSIEKWVEALLRQESIYPDNYVKLRFLENHDQERIGKYLKTPCQFRNLTALLFFQRGVQMVYNGQECGATKRPDLFELDPINWSGYNKAGIADLISKMNGLKKELGYLNGALEIEILTPHVLEFRYCMKEKSVIGLFNLAPEPQTIELKHGGRDLLSGRMIASGRQKLTEPLVFIN